MRIGYFDMRGYLAECPEPLERFAEGLEQDVHLSTSLHRGGTTLQSVEWWRATSMGARIALSTQLHPKHQMTCMLKVYPLLMDPPHGAISGPMQWHSIPTLTITHMLTVPALC